MKTVNAKSYATTDPTMRQWVIKKEPKTMHTATPWKVKKVKLYDSHETGPKTRIAQSDGVVIADAVDEETAAFIVTACNEYYENKRKADAYGDLVKIAKTFITCAKTGIEIDSKWIDFAETTVKKAGVNP